MHQYCTETEFIRYARKAQRHVEPMRRLFGWSTYSGSVYQTRPDGPVSMLFRDGIELGAMAGGRASLASDGDWYYDDDTGVLYYYGSSDPDTLNMDAGEDRKEYVKWLLEEASGHIDAMLDGRFQTPRLKNRDGDYDRVIIQSTAYMAGYLVSLDTDTELAELYGSRLVNENGMGVIDQLNAGNLKLRSEVDATSAKGEINEIGVTFDSLDTAFSSVDRDFDDLAIAGTMQLVETRGVASGVSWDMLKIKIVTEGGLETATYSTWGASATTLKSSAIVVAETITGQFQLLGYGLYGRFSAGTAISGDEWECEVRGTEERVSHGITSFQAVR